MTASARACARASFWIAGTLIDVWRRVDGHCSVAFTRIRSSV